MFLITISLLLSLSLSLRPPPTSALLTLLPLPSLLFSPLILLLISSLSSSVNNTILPICIFFKSISFRVNVPVLSLNKYSTRPSSSGIMLALTTVPSISLSTFSTKYPKYARAKSRFTLRGLFVFIAIRVSLPVYITIPTIRPDATVVFVHSVLAISSPYSLSSAPIFNLALPLNEYISLCGLSTTISPSILPNSSSSLSIRCVASNATRNFQSVSPSS
ncbi:hypothetical protein AX774_g457 [Zancudomyces culisetae]|uniref:Uncharacterized protein n=1 Tax=Zancudomyces culisetae TaxID=1213189 RepID=A0A1R1PYF4_ZANCU|nr:hypothetical protein AX774_g457 [Zancudomyces culisetae]|eukprot:OMH85993.1 hypothetical protein AX774_g457 [Zancudomyces culisetae]